MILFFCILLVSLCVPLPTYAEADVLSDVDAEMTFTCKIKSFYSDGFIPQAGDTFYIEYTNAENTSFSMLLDASECVNDWKEVEMACMRVRVFWCVRRTFWNRNFLAGQRYRLSGQELF